MRLKDMTDEQLREYYYNKELEDERKYRIKAEAEEQRRQERLKEGKRELEKLFAEEKRRRKEYEQTPAGKRDRAYGIFGNITGGIILGTIAIGAVCCAVPNEDVKNAGTAMITYLAIIMTILAMISFVIWILIILFSPTGTRDNNSRENEEK